MKSIRSLWEKHRRSEFPDRCRGRECDGIDLVMLDADLAGCISTFLGNRGRLDTPQIALLAGLRGDAELVADKLTNEPERQYYARLARLAALVYGECTG